MGKMGHFLVALAVGVALALISWQAGVLDSNIFGFASGAAEEGGGAGEVGGGGAGVEIGASRVARPWG